MISLLQTRWLLIGLLALTATMFWTTQAQAYRYGRSYHRGYRGGRYGGNPVANAYAAQMRAAAMRNAAIMAAQAEIHRSYNYLRNTRVRLERELKYSDSMAAAEKAHRDAHLEYNQALDKLKDNPEYENTLEAVRAAHERLVALQDAPYSTPQARIALADKEATLQLALNRMRRDAKNVDPDFEDATRRSFKAAGEQAELRRKFEGSITQNPQWIAARASLEEARKHLAQAYMAGNRALASSGTPYSRRYPHR